MLKPIKEMLSREYQYYIYGTSNFGTYCYQHICASMGDDIIGGFVETNPHAQAYKGKKLLRPRDLNAGDSKTRVIISSFTHTEEMRQELLKCGFKKEQILEFPEYKLLFHSLWEETMDDISEICFWPPFSGKAEEKLVLQKIEWFISKTTKVILYSDNVDLSKAADNIITHMPELYKDDMEKSDMVYLWDLDYLDEVEMYNEKLYPVDKDFFHTIETGNYQLLQYYALSSQEKEQMRAESISLFEEMREKTVNYRQANIFCNGPSINEIYDMEDKNFDRDFNIIVNAAVRDEILVDMVKPACFILADIIYLSPKACCETLYDAIIKAWNKYRFWIIVFEHEKVLLETHFPELKNWIIGMPFSCYGSNYVFPTKDCFRVSETLNILTELAIPVASSLFNTIGIYGCTGKEKETNNGWGHSEKSNYDQLKQRINDMWPSLLRSQDWTTDYEVHCNVLQDILEYGEKQGRCYQNMTTSFIPALECRTKRK